MNKFGLLVMLGMMALINAEAPRYRPQQQQQQFQRFRQQPQFFSRQVQAPANSGPYAPSGWRPTGAKLVLPSRQVEFTTTTDYPSTTDYPEEPPTTIQNGGYAPSGWQPQGGRLVLPARQQGPPATSYGVPQQTYGAPARLYGPPAATTISPKEAESTEIPDDPAAPTANPEAEELDLGSGQPSGRLETEEVPQQPEQQDAAAAAGTQPGAYFVQYPDGSLQPVVYVAQPAGQVAVQAQPVSQPIQLYNPVLVPNIVSYSSQYQQSW